jgi:uncharacterized protein (DUF111 family)
MVNCKVCACEGKLCQVSPEYEDCNKLAVEQNVPLKVVQQEALRMLNERLGV